MTVPDVDVVRGIATIRRGKGGKGRVVPFGPHTGRALDRYLRLRRVHPKAGTPPFWLGGGGQTFGYTGLHKALQEAARRRPGIEGFHPHVLRHTAAQRYHVRRIQLCGLIAVAGWSRRDMLDRYTQATAAERAADEARRLNLGELVSEPVLGPGRYLHGCQVHAIAEVPGLGDRIPALAERGAAGKRVRHLRPLELLWPGRDRRGRVRRHRIGAVYAVPDLGPVLVVTVGRWEEDEADDSQLRRRPNRSGGDVVEQLTGGTAGAVVNHRCCARTAAPALGRSSARSVQPPYRRDRPRGAADMAGVRQPAEVATPLDGLRTRASMPDTTAYNARAP